jgi:hypothetical protein
VNLFGISPLFVKLGLDIVNSIETSAEPETRRPQPVLKEMVANVRAKMTAAKAFNGVMFPDELTQLAGIG